MSENYYKLLGISQDASIDDIKKVYRKLAKKYHPDTNNGNKDAEEKFKHISEAYKTLSDPEKRRNYDRFGTAEPEFNRFGGGMHAINLDDIIRNIQYNFGNMNDFGYEFTQQARPAKKRINPDIRIAVNINLKQALVGGKMRISLSRLSECIECNGTGYNESDNICTFCNGEGKIQEAKGDGNRIVHMIRPCPQCNGTGGNFTPCPKCNGQAYTENKTTLTVDIPPGILPLQILRVRDSGHEVVDKGERRRGNLYVVVDFSKSQDGVDYNNGSLFTTVKVPVDKIIACETVEVNILGIENAKIALNSSNEKGEYTSHIMIGQPDHSDISKNKKARQIDVRIKVLPSLPEKKISKDKRDKLVKLFREVYGESSNIVQPIGS